MPHQSSENAPVAVKLAVVWATLACCWIIFDVTYRTLMHFGALWPFSLGADLLLALISWGHWRKNRVAWWLGLLLASTWIGGSLFMLPSLMRGLMVLLFQGQSISLSAIGDIRLTLFDIINISWFVTATMLMVVALFLALSRRGRATYAKTKLGIKHDI